MNAEFLAVLDHLEREKGVSRQVLLDAVSSALTSAARKVMSNKEGDVEVNIDEKTGDISVFCEGKRIESGGFGRIAAQTAKQVIIQKIREAERDAIYVEFHTKVNSILSGTVYRYDKGAVILDVGKTEALLLKRDQSPRDSFRQGDRARVFVIEVSKSAKGPQVMVSRNHPGLVKKLFEMEVPEVLEGIVEIKAVARDAGDRTKIAVWSKDEKVDCVGACVGMRGMRVKNIVRELQGEKIDIVRWSEDISEYVRGAISPAQCTQVSVKSREEKRVDVVVEDDQLSLAIGRSGQNVRLAAKLTGWMIDIRSKKDLAKQQLEGMVAAEAVDSGLKKLSDLDGVGPKVEEALVQAGLKDVAMVTEATLEMLMKIEGIGVKTAEKIQACAQKLSKEPSKSEQEKSEDKVSSAKSPAQAADKKEAPMGTSSEDKKDVSEADASKDSQTEGEAPSAANESEPVDGNQADEKENST